MIWEQTSLWELLNVVIHGGNDRHRDEIRLKIRDYMGISGSHPRWSRYVESRDDFGYDPDIPI